MGPSLGPGEIGEVEGEEQARPPGLPSKADGGLWEVPHEAGQGAPLLGASVGVPWAGRTDWPVLPELDLQDLCTEGLESAELDGLWTSTCVFVSLFLLSVSYGATITLFKVGPGAWA
ncbi:Hypothetical predicted protein, partial [Marmota monax]